MKHAWRIIIFGMKPRTLALIILSMLLVAGGMTIYAWSMKPRLIEMSPQMGAKNVPATASLRLTFSRSMDHESVITHLSLTPPMEGTFRWTDNSLIFTPVQLWPSGQIISLHLDAGTRAAVWLSFPMDGNSWSFATSEVAMAYLWPSSGPADIYSLDPATGSIRRYTQGLDVRDYTVSRDGKIFYFSAGNAQGGTNLFRIDRMEADIPMDQTYQPEKLLDCGSAQCRNPAVSADGQTIAYEKLSPGIMPGTGGAQVWMVSLKELTTQAVGQAGHETVNPAWSTTGLLAYYDKTSNVYEVYNPATGERIQLPNQTGQPGAWSPDGKDYLAPEISYQQASGTTETGSSHLMRYRVRENSSLDLSGKGLVEDVEAVYSPTGQSIAFTRKFLDAAHWSPGRQIWIMSPDGSHPHPITDEPRYNHYDLAWSVDGQRLAYVRFNQEMISDPPELWIVNADGSDPLQLVIGGYSPEWIP